MKRFAFTVVLAALVALPSTASAQERGQAGVTMGFPSAIGFQWHLSEGFAVRPEISFARSTAETQTENPLFPSSAETTSSTLSLSVSGIWYVQPASDNVRPYLSPRIGYGRVNTDSGLSDPRATDAWSGSGSFGVQYSPSRRFSVFGEAGIGFTNSENTFESTSLTITSKSTSWATRTAVGVIVYFGR